MTLSLCFDVFIQTELNNERIEFFDLRKGHAKVTRLWTNSSADSPQLFESIGILLKQSGNINLSTDAVEMRLQLAPGRFLRQFSFGFHFTGIYFEFL